MLQREQMNTKLLEWLSVRAPSGVLQTYHTAFIEGLPELGHWERVSQSEHYFILVLSAYDPSGLWLRSRALIWSNTRSP